MNSNLSLFRDPLSFNRSTLAGKLAALAKENIFIGTGSWRYSGWLGTIYTPERYMYQGKVAKKRFEERCLAEYAETFPVVGGDFSFYAMQEQKFWDRLFKFRSVHSQVCA